MKNTNNQEKEQTTENPSRITVPFVKHLSHKINHTLGKFKVKTVFNNLRKNNVFFNKLKDKEKPENRTHVVHKIPCNNCDKVYVGQTKRYLRQRISEHKNNYKKPPKKHTALTQHMLDENHKFNFTGVKIVANEKNYKKRMVKEIIHIV